MRKVGDTRANGRQSIGVSSFERIKTIRSTLAKTSRQELESSESEAVRVWTWTATSELEGEWKLARSLNTNPDSCAMNAFIFRRTKHLDKWEFTPGADSDSSFLEHLILSLELQCQFQDLPVEVSQSLSKCSSSTRYFANHLSLMLSLMLS
jgi:hypothetical protein